MSLQGCSYATLLLGRAGLIVAPAAQAQAPERALLSSTITPLGNLDNHVRARDTAGVADVPIDCARALLSPTRPHLKASLRRSDA